MSYKLARPELQCLQCVRVSEAVSQISAAALRTEEFEDKCDVQGCTCWS